MILKSINKKLKIFTNRRSLKLINFMIDKIKSNPQINHFFLYMAAFGLYGFVIAVPGPVIPFMAAKYSLP